MQNETPEAAPLLDVVMPYYGDVGMMQGAVNSVLAQTDPRWRLTVVDDGVAPGVPEWFAEVGAADPRVRYQRNERNLGITNNFQKCLDLAEAEFVTMIGCDDEMRPGYVGSVLATHAAHQDLAMVQPGVEVIDGDGAVVAPLADRVKRGIFAPRFTGTKVMRGEDLARSLLRGNWMYFPSICWRTKAIQGVGFDPSFTVVQDLAVTMTLVRAGASLAVTDDVCFRYRRHSASESSVQAFDGTRFSEERRYLLAEADRVAELGWAKAAKAGRAHLASRLHAATLVPAAAKRGDGASLRALTGFALGPARRTDVADQI
jgi:glycosyltransferase involved in cell wall biosynthesis